MRGRRVVRVGIPLVALAMAGFPGRAEAQNPRRVDLGPPKPQALAIEGHEIVPRFVLEPSTGPGPPNEPSPVYAPMIFATGGRDRPVVLVRELGRWSLRSLDLDGDWEFVGVLGDRQVWAVLDTQWQSSWTPVTLVRSLDGGRSWRVLGEAPKPSNWARFEGLRMDSRGYGRLTLRVDTDGVAVGGESVAEGLYHYRTEDSGSTWSEPELESDSLRSAATTAAHPHAGWDSAVHQHPLWRDYLESAPKEERPEFEGITWSDQGRSIRIVVHTARRLEEGWSHVSLRDPARELVVVRGLGPVDSQELPVGSDLLETIRVGTHWKEAQGEIHVVLDLAASTVYVRSIQVVEGTDLEIVLSQR